MRARQACVESAAYSSSNAKAYLDYKTIFDGTDDVTDTLTFNEVTMTKDSGVRAGVKLIKAELGKGGQKVSDVIVDEEAQQCPKAIP